MSRLLITVLFLSVIGCGIYSCHYENKKATTFYHQYPFDTNIISKLPLYDSLAAVILYNSIYFQQLIDTQSSYRSFRYRPYSGNQNANSPFPVEVAQPINHFFSALGKHYIEGFDFFTDSTIKITVRSSHSDSLGIDIFENLSYYPSGSHMSKRAFPVKDTILNNHWQYWIDFFKPRIAL